MLLSAQRSARSLGEKKKKKKKLENTIDYGVTFCNVNFA